MAWLYLLAAGLLEAVWALLLKQSASFTRIWPSIGFAGAAAISLVLLALALRTIPVGTAYGVWTGIGAMMTFGAGIVLLGENSSALRLASVPLIAAGLVGLRVGA